MKKALLNEFLLIPGLLALLLIISFYDIVFLNKTFKVTTANSQALPQGVYGQIDNRPAYIPVNGTDASVLEEPLYEFIRQNLKKGILPLWNPHQACGYPLIGMIQVAMFYPLNIILYSLPSAYSWDIFILMRLLCAGIFTYWFMRSLACKKTPAFISAVIFMLSGPMLLLQYWTANVDITLPLILLSYELLIKRPLKQHIALLALTLSLAIYGGHPEHIFLVHAYGFVYFAFRLLSQLDRTNGKKVLLYFLFSYALAITLSAPVLFPFLTNMATEFWHGHPDGVGKLMEENPARAITLLVPHFFQKENLTYKWVFAGWWGGYIGVLPFALSFFSLFSRQKRGLNYFFAAMGFILIAKAYGVPVISWLGYLPIFDMIRYAIHTPAIVAFTIAVCAGLGVRYLLNSKKILLNGLLFSSILLIILGLHLIFLRNTPQNSLPLKASFFTLSLLFIFNIFLWLKEGKFLNRKYFSMVLIAMTFLELFLYIHRERPHRFDSFAKVPYIEFLKSSPERIRSYGNFWAFYPNTASGFGVDDLGYFLGLVSKRFVSFVDNMLLSNYFKRDLRPPALRAFPLQGREFVLDLLNIKYIILPAQNTFARNFPRFENIENKLPLVYDNEVKIYERPGTFPRAYIVHRVFFKQKDSETFYLMNKIKDQLSDVAIVNSFFDPNIYSYLKKTPAKDNSSAEIQVYSPNIVKINAEMESAGFLILTDAYYPGWKAYVDGKKQKLFQTNYLFRSVFLPQGSHSVKFVYAPSSFYLGVILFLLSLGICAFLLTGKLRKKTNELDLNIE